MAQKNNPGYPLPSGELGEDEIVCQLVYLPDRPEYWQALLAAIHYMSTWRAWARDDDKRGKDAAANWRAAFELTIGCWRMTCLEELTQTVTDILELLQTRKDCCDDNITYLPTEGIETDIIPNVGDPPDLYGETGIEDWDEWASHVCYNAHQYVDYLKHAGDTLWDAAKSSSIIIGLVAALLTLLAFSDIGLPIAFGAAATIVTGIVLGGTIATFAGSEDALESARQDIVCAILEGTGLSDAVETALGSGLDWDLFYQFVDYESAISIIYEGGAFGEYLPVETREDCGCTYFLKLLEGDSLLGYKPVVINSETKNDGDNDYEAASMQWRDSEDVEFKNCSLISLSFDNLPNNDQEGYTFEIYNAAAEYIYLGDLPPELPLTVAGFRIIDQRPIVPGNPGTEFNVTVEWEDV